MPNNVLHWEGQPQVRGGHEGSLVGCSEIDMGLLGFWKFVLDPFGSIQTILESFLTVPSAFLEVLLGPFGKLVLLRSFTDVLHSSAQPPWDAHCWPTQSLAAAKKGPLQMELVGKAITSATGTSALVTVTPENCSCP